MSQFQVLTRVCDDAGMNCQTEFFLASENLPQSTGFGIDTGSVEFWQILTAYALLMATVWTFKAIIFYIKGR